MVAFLIKSILCLGILYTLYIVLLRRSKTFVFNRYFLLGALLFSIIIPLVHIPIDFNGGVTSNVETLKSLTATIVQVDENIYEAQNRLSITYQLLPVIYFSISVLLLIRFLVNLFRVSKTITSNKIISKPGYKLVLVSSIALPYSFLDYIIVNKEDYEKDTLNQALLRHELAHCEQKHSLDILFLEIIKIFFWINPFIWMIKKSIQLNHEYLADIDTVSESSIKDYQTLLYEIVYNNNTGILTSNFSLSLTKQRLKMMTRQFSKTRSIINYFCTTIVLIFLSVTLTFSQEKDFNYKLFINGISENYAKTGLRQSDFALMKITTNNRKIKVKEFEITLARGNRAVHYNKNIQGNLFDLKSYSGDAREGDRIVIEIKELSDEKIELTQYNSIVTIPILFD